MAHYLIKETAFFSLTNESVYQEIIVKKKKKKTSQCI